MVVVVIVVDGGDEDEIEGEGVYYLLNLRHSCSSGGP